MTPLLRRTAVALALGAALATSGCSAVSEANEAADVGGHVITESEVQTARQQINTAFPQANLSASDVLTRLIRAPYLIDYVAKKGNPQSESVARAAYPGDNPSPSTIELLRAELSIQYLDQNGTLELSKVLQGLKVTVNPRYGSFTAESAEVTPQMPSWVKPYNSAQS